jgi:hypothetical protein
VFTTPGTFELAPVQTEVAVKEPLAYRGSAVGATCKTRSPSARR